MPKKCPDCNKPMKETHGGVYECEECKSAYVQKDARDKIKSIFGITITK